MCQYYQWTCSCCISVNECVVQCATAAVNLQKCLRYGDCLPLPQDAPPLRCVHCHRMNKAVYPTAYQNPAKGPQYPQHDARPQAKKPFQGAGDPQIATMIAFYDKRRSEVFAAARKSPSDAELSGKNAAWEQAWDELRNRMVGDDSLSTKTHGQARDQPSNGCSNNGRPSENGQNRG
ncbi:hypothetical protein M409DRAFT_51814 [Zasmidium cellare ATCC 36951]|uniref:Uncharacterized protein n=1 Tax=Zasmidium cellare ATCC 36951 TaxID=1080233 RepID=A0A6A6CSB0_ZASCE|nr:uncharacterized protein M409DRAFT_51814 [Zasmidium cellare ATCC 36951]KAF2170044.1 hypothetical protein M409DRAFT_51814 [Zasmidium cellare ATCC 36951]